MEISPNTSGLPDIVHVQVTAQDIADGLLSKVVDGDVCETCPVGRAATRAFGVRMAAAVSQLTDRRAYGSYDVPQAHWFTGVETRQWIRDFDAGCRVAGATFEPFEFDATYAGMSEYEWSWFAQNHGDVYA